MSYLHWRVGGDVLMRVRLTMGGVCGKGWTCQEGGTGLDMRGVKGMEFNVSGGWGCKIHIYHFDLINSFMFKT